MTRDHVAAATGWARAVVDGAIPASRLTRAACQRQLDDLARAERGEGPWRWDPSLAGRPCRFIEQLPHIKGPKARAGEMIVLEPWQCWIITTLYGWIRRDTSRRRFRRGYVEVSRGNAKSTIAAGLALYALCADGEPGPEVPCGATTRDQARIVFDTAGQMLRKRPKLARSLGLKVGVHAITHPASGGKLWPISREADNLDGLNVSLGILDELHAHRTRELYDVIETGAAKRDASMLFTITTAGSDVSGICFEIRSYVQKVLEGSLIDDSLFGVIFTIDPEDDWTDPKVWPKANPGWSFVDRDMFAANARKAIAVASAQNNFRTKHLNVWCSADVSWMNLQAWDRCADAALKLEAFAKAQCFIGLDLASRVDIAAKVLLFWRDLADGLGGKHRRHWFVFLASYLPEETVRQSTNASYAGWAAEGWITATPGTVTDFDVIERDVLADRDGFRVIEVPFDPAQGNQLVTRLLAAGVPMVEFRPNVLNFSEPMKELEALVLDGRLHHDGNPVLRWMVSNVVCHRDAKDNIYPRKERPENKIDGVVALISALGRALVSNRDPSPYETRGIITLDVNPFGGRRGGMFAEEDDQW